MKPIEQYTLNPVLKGKIIKAQYDNNQVIKGYAGNPMIEAMPKIMGEDELLEAIPNYPDYDQTQRKLNRRLRLHCVQQLSDYVEILPIHLYIEQRFSRMIRHGFVARNPLQREYARQFHVGFEAILEAGVNEEGENSAGIRSTAAGFNIIGVSGQGKSTAVDLNLLLYPQVIQHTNYNDKPLILDQLVWLKLNCPFDGSIKGLCINFFQAVDAVLGTKYFKKFVSRGSTTDALIPQMAQIASLHCLGTLVIDEIQNLSQAKSGGSEKMLNFFTQLINTIGVPVVLVGTFKALRLFGGSFSQARRGCGQGDMIIDRMSEGEDWDYFVSSMWKYQWTNTRSPLTEAIKKTIYDLTQGIVDIAVKLYMLAQWDAISLGESEGGTERITAARFKKVASKHLQLVQPMIKALKTHNKSALYDIDDLYPKWNDFSNYLSQSEEKVSVHGKLRESTMPESNVDHDRVKILELVKLAVSLGSTTEKAEEIAIHIIKNNETHTDITILRMEVAKLIMRGNNEPDPNDIRNYVPNKGKASPDDLYKALSEAGYTGSNDVLFPEGSVS
ncbi:Transposon Tn7 transposition protein TnsC [compost metagenome]